MNETRVEATPQARALARLLAKARTPVASQSDVDALILTTSLFLSDETIPSAREFAAMTPELHERGRERSRMYERLQLESDERLIEMAAGFTDSDLLQEFISAWARQLPQTVCPMRLANGKECHRLRTKGVTAGYGEDIGDGWREIKVANNHNPFSSGQTSEAR